MPRLLSCYCVEVFFPTPMLHAGRIVEHHWENSTSSHSPESHSYSCGTVLLNTQVSLNLTAFPSQPLKCMKDICTPLQGTPNSHPILNAKVSLLFMYKGGKGSLTRFMVAHEHNPRSQKVEARAVVLNLPSATTL